MKLNATKDFVKKTIKSIVNTTIKPLGLEIHKTSRKDYLNERYQKSVNEINECLSELLFTDLPRREHRVELLAKLFGTNPSEALYIINFLHKSLMLEGDICEFGVAQGATSALLANEIKSTSKILWLFDSFEGLPKPTDKDILKDDVYNLGSMEKYEGAMSYGINEVTSRIDQISFPKSRIKIVPGFIEKSIKSAGLPSRVCFAYIDFDFYEPIKIALSFLDKSLSTGGFIVVDDYDYFSTGGKTAVDEFVEENRERYELILPHKFAGHFCILKKKP